MTVELLRQPRAGVSGERAASVPKSTIELMEQLSEKRHTQLYDDVTGVVTEAQRGGYTAIAVKKTLVRGKADLRTGTPEIAIEHSAASVLVGQNRDPAPLSLHPRQRRCMTVSIRS